MEKSIAKVQQWITEGDQFLKAATPKTKKSRFNASIRYNLLSMSLEKYIMAILIYNKRMPDNHTYTDLINALEEVYPIETALKNQILKYENIQSICSVDKFLINAPSHEELVELQEAINEIKNITYTSCNA